VLSIRIQKQAIEDLVLVDEREAERTRQSPSERRLAAAGQSRNDDEEPSDQAATV
jgi:hypothetical protein